MTDPANILSGVDAVLAARRRGDTVSTSRYVELIHATYPEALAVVRNVAMTHDLHHGGGDEGYPLVTCAAPECRSVAAYLAKAQDATEAGS